MKRPEWIIPEWSGAWRWLSVHAAALAVVWGTLPSDVQGDILVMLWGLPQERVPAVLGVLMLVGRLISQPKKSRGLMAPWRLVGVYMSKMLGLIRPTKAKPPASESAADTEVPRVK